jgi:hypothetical protein
MGAKEPAKPTAATLPLLLALVGAATKIFLLCVTLALFVFAGLIVARFVAEWRWSAKRARFGSDLIASYRKSALRGDVPAPATNAGALRCGGTICYLSLPHSVEVTVPSGATYVYIARSNYDANVPWRFEFSRGRDKNGISLTNEPGL